MNKIAQLISGPGAEHWGKFLLRFILSFGMLFHGVGKLAGGAGHIAGMLQESGIPGFIGYGVIVGEVLAPLLILFGYKSRLGGLVMSFTMLVAILLVHPGDIFSLADRGTWAIELPMLYLIGGIAVSLLGAGKYSLSKGEGDWD
ncbi:MAG: DoxX family protein [Reichenbachiella sp.]|uniref:DoxX family protein n=1 Tax=Reichenbachiella sp. TaxID=2184521 RepID=UPI0032637432